MKKSKKMCLTAFVLANAILATPAMLNTCL